MNFSFTEEQELIRDSARDFLSEESSSEKIRKAMLKDVGYELKIWESISADMGWTALRIPEEYGGLDLGHVELCILLEEMGSSLLCSPYYSTVCLAVSAFMNSDTEILKQEYLPKIAEGSLTATLAFDEENTGWDASGINTSYQTVDDGFLINGSKRYVLDGHSADLVIVAARSENSIDKEGLSLFVVTGEQEGLKRELLTTMDQTRKQAQLDFDNVLVSKEQLLGEEGKGWELLEKTLQHAGIALAAEQLGGSQKCLDMTVDYSKERVQFDRPIGSFQAVKHKCADMMVKVESARSAVYYAACIADEDTDELKEAAAIAQAYCSEVFMHCAADAVQLHGGIGFTWEYDLHLFFKRARAMEHYLGSPDYHRELVAQSIGLT